MRDVTYSSHRPIGHFLLLLWLRAADSAWLRAGLVLGPLNFEFLPPIEGCSPSLHPRPALSAPLQHTLPRLNLHAHASLCLQLYEIPGIGIPAKVLVAQITDNFVVLMVGFLGHELPLLSLADCSGVGFTMDSPSRSVNLYFADIRPMGTLAHFTGGGDDCSLVVRIVLETQAAFWGLAYRLAQPLADPVAIATAIWANQPIIQMLLDSFRADDGSEHFGGARVDEAPPGYTDLLSTSIP
ncbi:hypothetical protein B0H19DRAFT_1055677 [Mycena capillaripes]|nr:hypothetical protein B0H19DRAFT_1055677 [Mycena capillaripes]